jgi:uncharacterized protein (TIGR02001 family)
MKSKHIAALAAVLLAAPAAHAGELTGNVGATSDYMFRGVDQTGGAAVQGGVDYTFDFGLYTGLWVSNSTSGGGNEADAYVGYTLKLGEFGLDVGAIYYGYTEDTEVAAPNGDYAEVYVGGGIGPVALKVFYAPEFGGDIGLSTGNDDKDALLYVTASAQLTLTDSVTFVPQVGFSSGDGAKDGFGDEYADFSLTATKALKDDMSVSLAVVGTDRDLPAGSDNKDNPKFVISFKKHFDI